MAKFKGALDDRWADFEKKEKQFQKKKREAKAVELPRSKANAVVTEVFQDLCKVRFFEDDQELLCVYQRAQVVGYSENRQRTPVCVGDWVLAHSAGAIHGLCERTNEFTRIAPRKTIRHALACNLDTVVVIASATQPDFPKLLVDRFLVEAEAQQIAPIVCVTKMDLFSASSIPLEKPWDIYPKIGYPVFEVSREANFLPLKEALSSKVCLFVGASGVGKTSLLRLLTGLQFGKIGELDRSHHGRHTTTGTLMLPQFRWIDSPGVREFALEPSYLNQLEQYFPEFRNLKCYQKCSHTGEPHCDAIHLPRYESYLSIRNSLITAQTTPSR